MFDLKVTSSAVRRALLVGLHQEDVTRNAALELLEELGQLVDTLGIEVTARELLKVPRLQPRYLIGSGKASEIASLARQNGAGVIVFDQPISPAQQRNWEKLSQGAVIDREEVILEIFNRRARTTEARLQVELARMQYSLPRLKRAWQHLSRQGGPGMGAMGAGETQLETDRRLVRRRIDYLKHELIQIESRRATRRKQRERQGVPHAAIVGYTNAGKSFLFRCLTGAAVLVEDRLFATLDTTTRLVQWQEGRRLPRSRR